ncbi:aspartyl protease family protein [uncultured Algoriphagus sp.]|uniref:retroviral-like aspartic protease family protein n=1 Tax=uncultured Algoriphagus sp. TaxID=417365 RepID=UPI00258CA7AA|nr:aspartyl protease family protein [uncultured Algoriphagus sp.]
MKKSSLIFRILTIILLFSGTKLSAQSNEDTVFTIPFHMDARLLIFKGKMNGQEIDFAFDTGAAMGLAGKNVIDKGGISRKRKSMTLTDANKNRKKVRTANTNLVEIGGFKISNVSSLLFDMPYLVCHDYYLLGSNVIEKLNWKIDFDEKLIHVSLKPFPVESHFLKVPVKYLNNRPFLDFSFEGYVYENILIDTGFTGVLDLSDRKTTIQDFLASKKSLGLDNPNISLSTGAVSQTIAPTTSILLKSLKIADVDFPWIPANFEYPTTEKIGLGFFSHFTKQTIINNSESAYYLNLKENPGRFKDPNHLDLNFQDGKVLISGKSIGLSPEDELIEIGEEILEVNGIPTASFEDQCQFVQWYYGLKLDQMIIKKTNGQELIFSRIPVRN